MKNFMSGGPGSALSAAGMFRALPAREQIIRLMPTSAAAAAGYVWQRVFLKARPQRD
ncbi:MAG: hypothetical protein WCU88_05480 [Elusimicrobiota bacterium]|jgi:hypothetical protein